MLCVRHRLCQSGPIFILCSLILSIGFIIQFKILYAIHQRNARFEEYKAEMKELSDTMETVVRVSNVTNVLLNRIKKMMESRGSRIKLLHKVS